MARGVHRPAADPGFSRVLNAGGLGLEAPLPRRGLALRAVVRTLEGMRKEALVVSSATGATWRVVSDEGQYLAGTDLAPPPLGLFCAGMAAAHANELLALAGSRGVELGGLQLVQDTFYSMEGSALRGTMIGGALPPELLVEAGTSLDEDELLGLTAAAVASSPITGLVRGVHDSLFTLVRNGEQLEVGRVRGLPGPPASDPRESFDLVEVSTPAEELLVKVREAEQVEGEGGAGSSLRPEQSRTLHVQAACSARGDGVKVVEQFLFQPAGSQFRLLSAEDGSAPDAHSYLAAGIGFCFLTQLGRYAAITRRALEGYRIVQDLHLSTAGGPADPVETHVFLDTSEDADSARQMLDMSEQTCFLHALCRTDLDPRVRVR